MSLKCMAFKAAWCNPCRMLAPIVEKAAAQNPDVEFISVDVDLEPDLATKMKVRAVPTMVFLKDDVVVKEMVGLTTLDNLLKVVNELKGA